jgi:hypothetical protein
MARLRPLLGYARLAGRRERARGRSGGDLLLELCLGAVVAVVLLRKIASIVAGPVAQRDSAAHLLILVLASLWMAVPFSLTPSIPLRALAVYPLTGRQRAAYRILSYVQNGQILFLLFASLLALLSLVRLPQPGNALVRGAAVLTLAAISGLVLAHALSALLNRTRSTRLTAAVPPPRPLPLLRKNLRFFTRILDPYLALLFSIAAAGTEYFGAWMTPAKVLLPLLPIAIFLTPAVLNPFGLETPAELNRYRLFPQPYWKLLFQKHLALGALFLACALPVLATCALRMSLLDACANAAQALLVLVCWLLTGLILMRTRAARHLRMAFGTISGSDMSPVLLAVAVLLLAAVPVVEALAVRGAPPVDALIAVMACVFALVGAYVGLLKRQKWPGVGPSTTCN